jgi:hypothetical protein
MTHHLTADKAKARIEAFLARDALSVLARTHILSPHLRHRRSAHAHLRLGLSPRGAQRRPAPLLKARFLRVCG